jgi:hypothetical protein
VRPEAGTGGAREGADAGSQVRSAMGLRELGAAVACRVGRPLSVRRAWPELGAGSCTGRRWPAQDTGEADHVSQKARPPRSRERRQKAGAPYGGCR